MELGRKSRWRRALRGEVCGWGAQKRAHTCKDKGSEEGVVRGAVDPMPSLGEVDIICN